MGWQRRPGSGRLPGLPTASDGNSAVRTGCTGGISMGALAPSRRGLLAAGVAAVATAARAASAGSSDPLAAPGTSDKGRHAGLALTDDPALHVARRLTWGATPALVDQIRAVGVDAFIADQLDMTVPDAVTSARLAAFPTLALPALAAQALQAQGLADPVPEAQVATVLRAAHSSRQLFEVVVDCWSDHFTVHAAHPEAAIHKPSDDRDVVRAHAFGRFADLVAASAKSPAMLLFLDNASSDGRNPNENYARELLELHTVGVDGGYTERDVKQAALALTGWTVDPQTLQFHYDAARHRVGALRVMGWRHPNASAEDGQAVGESLLLYLARHSSTARHVCRRLIRRLVSDDVPHDVLTAAMRTYQQSDTAIVPVLRTILASRAFRDSAGAKHRRPYEWFVAAVRSLGLTVSAPVPMAGTPPVLSALHALGQVPWAWPTPDGYPDATSDWLTTAGTLARWNIALALAHSTIEGISAFDPDTFLGTPLPATAGALVDRVLSKTLMQSLPPSHRQALLSYLAVPGSAAMSAEAVRAAAPDLAALVLSSPYAQVR